MKVIAAVALFYVLAGCAPDVPVRVDTTRPYVENQKVISQCIDEADRKYPIDLYSYKTEDYIPIRVTCNSYGDTTSCQSYGGYSIPGRINGDMNESKAISHFDSCMRRSGAPLVSLPYCLGVKDGEYCYGLVYPQKFGLYSGRTFMINGSPWHRRYFMLGPNEMGIFQKQNGILIPEQL